MKRFTSCFEKIMGTTSKQLKQCGPKSLVQAMKSGANAQEMNKKGNKKSIRNNRCPYRK